MRYLLTIAVAALMGCQSYPPAECTDAAPGPMTRLECPEETGEGGYAWACDGPHWCPEEGVNVNLGAGPPVCDGTSPIARCPDGSEAFCVLVPYGHTCD